MSVINSTFLLLCGALFLLLLLAFIHGSFVFSSFFSLFIFSRCYCSCFLSHHLFYVLLLGVIFNTFQTNKFFSQRRHYSLFFLLIAKNRRSQRSGALTLWITSINLTLECFVIIIIHTFVLMGSKGEDNKMLKL